MTPNVPNPDPLKARIASSVISRDNSRARVRIGRSITASAVLHVLLFLLLLITGGVGASGEQLTEITWMDGDPGPAATPTPEVNSKPLPSGPAPQPVHYERRVEKADVTVDPQAVSVANDQLENRLATLQQQASHGSQPALAVGTGSGRGGAGLALAPSGSGGSGIPSPIAMHREGTPRPVPVELRRIEEPTAVPVAASIADAPQKAKAAARSESTARRELAGATLLGPVANRKLLKYSTPVYPDWAKREGVEGSVRLYFIVGEDGKVKDNIVVEKTSGYPDFDANANTALSGWLFERLPGNQVGDQWGQITFHFRLSDKR
jgi:TonB family protein